MDLHPNLLLGIGVYYLLHFITNHTGIQFVQPDSRSRPVILGCQDFGLLTLIHPQP